MKGGIEEDTVLQLQLELMTALSRSNGLEEALEHCYAAAVKITGMDSGGIYLVEPDGSLRLALHHGLGEAFVRLNGHVSFDDPRAALVRAGRSAYTSLAQVRADLGRDGADEGELDEGLRALAVVPIMFHGRAVGCMNLASHTLDDVPESSRDAVELFASQIAQSIARELASAAVREREQNLTTFFESADDLLFVLDEELRIQRFNSAVTRVLGYDAEVLEGASIFRLHPDAHHEEVAAAVPRDVEASVHRHEVPFVSNDGTCIAAETRLTRGEWNGVRAYFCVARDLRELEKAREERLALERQLFEAQKLESLGIMAGGIAHDFNNILVSVLGNASVALVETDEGSALRSYLEEIIKGARRAAALCGQMLAYSGRGRFLIEALDLSAQVRELSTLVRSSGDSQTIVELDLAESIASMEGDAAQISQVILNLLLNATEAMEGRPGAVRVRTYESSLEPEDLNKMLCAEAEPGRFVCLEVQDWGSGLDHATVDRLFEPFFTTKARGRGLGMAAVRGIVRGHRGALSLETALGEGTTFRVYFPVSMAPVERAVRPAPRILAGSRVLLVDDDPTVLTAVTRILKLEGFVTEAAASGEEALAMLAENPERFDAVLLDLSMPHLDGQSTFAALSAIDDKLPIVIMSGYTEYELTLREEKPVAFLGKPFSREELLDAVSAHARTRSGA